MITDIYEPIDDVSRESLAKIHTLIESDTFLAGLGQHCADYPIPSNFPVVTDMERSLYLLTSEEMQEEPEETRQDQMYGDVARFPVASSFRYEGDEYKRRKAPVRKTFGKLCTYLDARFEVVLEQHKIMEHLCSVHAGSVDPEKVKTTVRDVYFDIIPGHVLSIVEGAYFDGFDTWPIANQFYECYKTGGITAGWVGPLPDNGGVPQDCMQLMHYGPQAKA